MNANIAAADLVPEMVCQVKERKNESTSSCCMHTLFLTRSNFIREQKAKKGLENELASEQNLNKHRFIFHQLFESRESFRKFFPAVNSGVLK